MAATELTPLEEQIIEELDEPFRSRFLTVLFRVKEILARDTNVYVIVRDGWRDPKRQASLYAVGRTVETWRSPVTNAKPGYSPHEYRRAAHIVLMDRTTDKLLADSDSRWEAVGLEVSRFAPSKESGGKGLVSGRYFSSLVDSAHVEDANWAKLARKRQHQGLGPTEHATGEL
ncbi:endolysin-like protein [Bacteriophage sp.]|nr:endolysin-like protein [Bacteriophage sp.]UOF80089.1 endolysin-like protein [Bacteriophage sp.]